MGKVLGNVRKVLTCIYESAALVCPRTLPQTPSKGTVLQLTVPQYQGITLSCNDRLFMSVGLHQPLRATHLHITLDVISPNLVWFHIHLFLCLLLFLALFFPIVIISQTTFLIHMSLQVDTRIRNLTSET